MKTTGPFKDEKGRDIYPADRIACRELDEHPSESTRGLIFLSYDGGSPRPYVTNAGCFPLALRDHNPEMQAWVNKHVTIP